MWAGTYNEGGGSLGSGWGSCCLGPHPAGPSCGEWTKVCGGVREGGGERRGGGWGMRRLLTQLPYGSIKAASFKEIYKEYDEPPPSLTRGHTSGGRKSGFSPSGNPSGSGVMSRPAASPAAAAEAVAPRSLAAAVATVAVVVAATAPGCGVTRRTLRGRPLPAVPPPSSSAL